MLYIYVECSITYYSVCMKQLFLLFCVFGLLQNVKSQTDDFCIRLSDAALAIINPNVRYDSGYTQIGYPNGDVPANRGVCTDVLIRAYRLLDIDLQKEVHEDMKANFNAYPSKKIWGLKSTDRNIDHRRVFNLQTFFTRKGKVLPISLEASDYQPGDIVTWDLGGGVAHIGIVVNRKTAEGTPLVVHNYGGGQVCEDILFGYKITGHYRYGK